MFVGQTLGGFTAKTTREDLQALSELIEAGKVTPVVDRTFDLVESPDAVRYLAEGHPAGTIVVTVEGLVRYGAGAGPNHVVSASASPWVPPSPTHAT